MHAASHSAIWLRLRANGTRVEKSTFKEEESSHNFSCLSLYYSSFPFDSNGSASDSSNEDHDSQYTCLFFFLFIIISVHNTGVNMSSLKANMNV